MKEEDDYDEDEQIDQTIIIKQQKYTTWLYIFLLLTSIYILFYSNFVHHQQKTIIKTNISLDIYNKLYSEYSDTLSCSCSNINIPYHIFLNNTITYHPVCSSIFIRKEWINALYTIHASLHGTGDFRTTAYSQRFFAEIGIAQEESADTCAPLAQPGGSGDVNGGLSPL
ncbi:unnamed protein product [Adineta ricciae]|uniref:Uncharacterized protein n=1 Tax=Adineta ricciae TaxID=249248 RepID=A0A815XY42_ADIRI|nr:unnamed protein product [Adineta ricciae]